MLTIEIICIGKIKEHYLQDAINEYSNRLSKFCKLIITELPDEKIPNKTNDSLSMQVKQKECNKISSNIKKDSFLIALTPDAKQLSSEDFSNEIELISMKKAI